MTSERLNLCGCGGVPFISRSSYAIWVECNDCDAGYTMWHHGMGIRTEKEAIDFAVQEWNEHNPIKGTLITALKCGYAEAHNLLEGFVQASEEDPENLEMLLEAADTWLNDSIAQPEWLKGTK